MNSRVKRNLAIAGCLSALFVQATACYADQNVTIKDSVFNKIRRTGVMTGAAINIAEGGSQTTATEDAGGNVINKGTLTSTGALTGIETLENYNIINGDGSLTISNGGFNELTINQSAFNLNGGTFDNGHASKNGTITIASDMAINDGGTFNNGNSTAQGILRVTGTLTNSGSIVNAANSEITAGIIQNNTSKTIQNAGIITASLNNSTNATISGVGEFILTGGENNGSITQNNISVQSSTTYTNNGSITANNKFTNEGTIQGDNGSLIISDKSTDAANASSSSGEITQKNVTVSGTFNNNAKLTANTKLSNSGTINNTSDIVAGEIVNQTGAHLEGAGNLEAAKGSNKGTISQSIVTITGATFDNSGSLTANNTFTNSAAITGDGTLEMLAGGSTTGNITQDNITIGGSSFNANGTTITSNVNFTNSAALTGTGTLSIKDGSNTGTIEMGIVGVSGNYKNENTLTAGTLNNSGTITNTSTITAKVNNSSSTSKIEGANGGVEFLTGSTNSGIITQTIVTVTGNLANTGTLSANGDFTNNASITGDNGTLNINAGGTNSGSITQKNVSVAGALTNNDSITASNNFSNTGTLTNNGSITANNKFSNTVSITTTTTEDGKGILTVKNGSNEGSINLNSVTFTTGGAFENIALHSIEAKNLTNNGTLTNNGSLIASTLFSNTSTISGSGSLEVKTAGSNSGTIELDTLTIDKNFTNTGSGQINDTKTTIASTGNFTNEGEINRGTVTAEGKFENSTGATVTNSTLTIKGTGDKASTNSGTISGGTVNVEGSLTNDKTIENSTVTVNDGGELTNNKDIKGGSVTAEGKFENGTNGTVTNSTLTIKGTGDKASVNSGEISGGKVNVEGSLTNSGTISGSTISVGKNDGSVSGTLSNSGTITDGSLTVNADSSVDNSGTMGGSLNLTINNAGQVSVGGAGATLSTTGKIAVATGGSIEITEGGSVTLKAGDDWFGDISNTNGTLTLSGRDDTDGGYNSYIQNGGNLVLDNSDFILKDGSTITNGIVTLAGGSSFDITKGASMSGGELKYTGTDNVVNVYDTIAEAAQLDITDGITYNVLNDDGNVTLDNTDVWNGSGTVQLKGGQLNFKGTAANRNDDGTTTGSSNGILKADSGILLVNSALNISTNSYIEDTASVTINKDITIDGTGSVKINDNDTWASDATITQNGGSLSITNFDNTTQGQGTLIAKQGELSITNSIIDITGNDLIDAAVKTTISASTIDINNGGSVTLDKATDDSWSADSTIKLGADGTLDYSLDANGKLIAEGGNLNLNGGKLTLVDANDKIDFAVATVIKKEAALDVQNGNVTINGGTTGADEWKGTLSVSGSGDVTIQDVTSNGALQATGGKLTVSGSTLELGSDSKIGAGAETSLTSSTININGGNVNLNDKATDSWSDDTTIKLTTGSLDYNLDSNGKLVAEGGTLNLNGGTLTLDKSSSIAEAVKTTVKSDIIVKGTGDEKSILNLNNGDSWTAGVITVDEDGIFNYKDITSVGTLVAQNGTFNLASGNLTLENTAGTADAGIAADVDATIAGNLTIKDNVAVVLDDPSKDSWTGHISLDGGSLDYKLNSNGQLTAEKGDLTVSAGKLTLAAGSYVKDPVTTVINSSVDIKGGELNLNQGDSWSRDSVINLNEGTLNYADLAQNGVFQGVKGNLNTKEGSTFNVVGNADNDSYIKSDIVANIKGDLIIGDKGTVDLGTVKEGDAPDTVLGNITVNNGGTLNVFNDLNFKPVKAGEYSDQLITIDENGKMNLNTTGELHLYPNLTGTGPVDKNGEGDVWFHGTITDDLKITIKNGGDLLFEQGLGGNLIVGEEVEGKGLTIGIHSDEIKGDLLQERDITMKYSTYHDDIDLNLASEPGSVVNVTKGTLIAESKGDNNINFGGAITVKPAENWEKPVTMTAISNGSINFNNNVSVTNAVLNLTAGQNNHFAKDVVLNNSTINISSGDSANFDTVATLNDSIMNVYAGNLNFNTLKFTGTESSLKDMNGAINHNTIQNLDIYKNGLADFTVDVNGRDWKHDKFVISDLTTMDGGRINVSDWQFADDWRRTNMAPIDRHIVMNMFDVSKVDPALAANITFTQTDKQIFTPIGWYKLENYTKWNRQLGAYESVPGVLQASLARYNPQVFRGQVATMAMWNNQLAIDDMILNHVSLSSERFLAQGQNANRYAINESQFAPYQYRKEDGGLWFKSYVNFETLSMTQGLNVHNNSYGSIVGADFPVVDMEHGWKFMPTAYIGYNGSHQSFNGVSMYQNGGQAGFMGTFMKNDFIGSVLAYGGGYNNEMTVEGHTDKAGNWFAGTAAKAAYNLHATKHFTVQPTLMLAYNIFGRQNWGTDFGTMGMSSGYLNGINVAPGVNFIYARETWNLYTTIQYMYNINDHVDGRAGNVELSHVDMRHGYLQYGFGANKTWKDRLSSYVQIVIRNGGRTGVGFQLGAQYMFDWYKPKSKKIEKVQIKQEKTQIKTLSMK